MTLIAVATAFLRGALDGSPFGSAVPVAVQVGAGVFAAGLAVGELTRRLIEDTVDTAVQKILNAGSHATGETHHDITAAVTGL